MSNLNMIQEDLFCSKQKIVADMFFSDISENTKNYLGKNKAEAFTLMIKCEQKGFSFNQEMLNVLSHASVKELSIFWEWFQKNTKDTFHGSSYEVMYPNFPKQVMQASDVELFVNAFMHYTGDVFGIRIMPEYEKKSRKKLKEGINPIKMSLISKDDLSLMFKENISANTSLSEQSKKVTSDLFNYLESNEKNTLEFILSNTEIPQKENLAYIGAKVLKSSLDFNKIMVDKFKIPTDLLRLSAALNDGDVSLSVDTKIKNMSRPMRKAFLGKIEKMFSEGDSVQFLENMFTHREKWVRLAHAMHVGEYKDKVPLTFIAFEKLRSNDKEYSFNFQVEQKVNSGKINKALDLLVTRPGVFGRMLNNVLEKSDENQKKEVLKSFEKAAENIATPVLLQMHAKFKYSLSEDKKIILPKGGLGKIYVKINTEENQKKLNQKIGNEVVSIIENTLTSRFANGENLGNVYIDENLMLQNVPFAQRTSSKALKTVPKGSRFVKESDNEIIRFFVWWNENGVKSNGEKYGIGRVDIDLSVGIFDQNYNLVAQCAYYDLRSGYGKKTALVHSGDITSAPNGASEYIDVNLEALKENYPTAKFVAPIISSFTQQKYIEMPECYVGWMERKQKQHGEIFEPSTVKNKVDITCDSTQVLTVLFDIDKNEYIWADVPMKGASYVNNMKNVQSALSYAIQGLVEMKKPNLYDLFEMHAKARGTLVNKKEDANTVFSITDGITPFDYEKIASQFMADKYEKKQPKLKIK